MKQYVSDYLTVASVEAILFGLAFIMTAALVMSFMDQVKYAYKIMAPVVAILFFTASIPYLTYTTSAKVRSFLKHVGSTNSKEALLYKKLGVNFDFALDDQGNMTENNPYRHLPSVESLFLNNSVKIGDNEIKMSFLERYSSAYLFMIKRYHILTSPECYSKHHIKQLKSKHKEIKKLHHRMPASTSFYRVHVTK